MTSNDLKDERIARLTALLDCIEDARDLYPDTSYSMSRQEVVAVTRLLQARSLIQDAIHAERSKS